MKISWQNVEQMNSYSLENVLTHIVLEAFQDLLLSDYVMKWETVKDSVRERKYSMRERKGSSVSSVSSLFGFIPFLLYQKV